MAAWLLRFATLALLAAAAAWGVFWWQQGRPVVALVGAVCIAGVHAIVLAIEFVCIAFVNRADPAPAASAAQLVRAWSHEVWTAAVVFGWRQPYRANRFADRPMPVGRRGVVLVHGFFCNRAVWNRWLALFHARQTPVVAVNLEPVFASIDDYVPQIEHAVRSLEAATGLAPVVVAHSMGGLAVRAWLDRFAADARVRRVVTIGSPHHGTWLARFGVASNVRQMRRDSNWIDALAAREPASRFTRFTCYYSHCDNVVFPASTAMLPGADNRHLPGAAHVELVDQADVLAEVTRWLGDAAGVQSSLPRAAAEASAR